MRKFLFLLLVLFTQQLSAHKMSSLYLHFDADKEKWSAEMRFDAGYATPELRAVPEAPPLTVEYMKARPIEQLTYMREEMVKYVSEQFKFYQGDKEIVWSIEVPEFDKAGYNYSEFDEAGGVFFFLTLSAPFRGTEPLRLAVSKDCEVPVYVGVPNKKIEDERDIIGVNAGDEGIVYNMNPELPIPIYENEVKQEAAMSDAEIDKAAEKLAASLPSPSDDLPPLPSKNDPVMPGTESTTQQDPKTITDKLWLGISAFVLLAIGYFLGKRKP